MGLFVPRHRLNRGNCHRRILANSFAKERNLSLRNFLFVHLIFLCFTWIVVLASFEFCKQEVAVTPFQLSQVCHTSHIDHRSTQVTIVSNYTFPPVSCLLLCMDVEPNPGPQQIRISNLPNSIKLLFNQVKRTRLKITRYQSHLDNLLAS